MLWVRLRVRSKVFKPGFFCSVCGTVSSVQPLIAGFSRFSVGRDRTPYYAIAPKLHESASRTKVLPSFPDA